MSRYERMMERYEMMLPKGITNDEGSVANNIAKALISTIAIELDSVTPKIQEIVFYGQFDGAYHNFRQGCNFTHNQMLKNGWRVINVSDDGESASVMYER